ncbi:MAG: phosphomannomutase/phosphoglucomutase, partial [Planctomycetes bacterium]|nr:phosphomannomutase/phosphoglucomutase [Planctomycetota bacterium]
PLHRYRSSGELNFEVPDKAAKLAEIEKVFGDAEIDHLDGVTVSYNDWWFNIRASNTEPLLRLNLEAGDEKAVKEKLQQVTKLLGKPVKH